MKCKSDCCVSVAAYKITIHHVMPAQRESRFHLPALQGATSQHGPPPRETWMSNWHESQAWISFLVGPLGKESVAVLGMMAEAVAEEMDGVVYLSCGHFWMCLT